MSRSGAVNVFVVCVEAERPNGTDRYCDSVHFDKEKADEQAKKITNQSFRAWVARVPLMDTSKLEAARESIASKQLADCEARG